MWKKVLKSILISSTKITKMRQFWVGDPGSLGVNVNWVDLFNTLFHSSLTKISGNFEDSRQVHEIRQKNQLFKAKPNHIKELPYTQRFLLPKIFRLVKFERIKLQFKMLQISRVPNQILHLNRLAAPQNKTKCLTWTICIQARVL